MTNTIYWHDYETFGVDPRRDRASQFAGVRTDEDLNIVGEPMVMYCKPAPDMLPSPEACMITGISPQKALAEGVTEAEFIRRIHVEFAQPQTCVSGYNSLRFDDEVTRQLLYRNFYDPYEREWKNGNSRWDIIDMVRLCCALRPDGIIWPKKEDGSASFRLEELTKANGIAHESAHDALSDVYATIAMAKLIRTQQPKLYEYVYQLRDKQRVQALLDIMSKKPVLHVSSMYPAARGCLALVMPLTRHPTDKNGVIVYDLRTDPADWMSLPVEEIQRRLFTRQEDLSEGETRIPLKVIHANRCPVIAGSNLLDDALAQRYEVDLPAARRYWKLLADNPSVVSKVASAFDAANSSREFTETDPDFMIYGGGFFGAQDKKLMAQIHASSPVQLADWRQSFVDKRLAEMLFRYRARNYPESLNLEETTRWHHFCRDRLHRHAEVRSAGASLEAYNEEISRLRADSSDPEKLTLLDLLAEYGQLVSGVGKSSDRTLGSLDH